MVMLSGYVISDLHLFAERSAAHGYLPEIRAAAAKADFFVLNGDVFDFRWSVLPSVEDTVDAAVQWLEDLAKGHPRCRFYYVLGNHDGLQPFTDRLADLALQTDNLEWLGSHLRIGSALFLHGDLPRPRRRPRSLVRSIRPNVRRRGKALNLCYRLAVAMRIHKKLAALAGRPKRSAKRIVRALKSDRTGLAEGLTDVYSGHTHLPFSGYRHGGLTFHNTGSAVRGLRCDLLAVRAKRGGT